MARGRRAASDLHARAAGRAVAAAEGERQRGCCPESCRTRLGAAPDRIVRYAARLQPSTNTMALGTSSTPATTIGSITPSRFGVPRTPSLQSSEPGYPRPSHVRIDERGTDDAETARQRAQVRSTAKRRVGAARLFSFLALPATRSARLAGGDDSGAGAGGQPIFRSIWR